MSHLLNKKYIASMKLHGSGLPADLFDGIQNYIICSIEPFTNIFVGYCPLLKKKKKKHYPIKLIFWLKTFLLDNMLTCENYPSNSEACAISRCMHGSYKIDKFKRNVRHRNIIPLYIIRRTMPLCVQCNYASCSVN